MAGRGLRLDSAHRAPVAPELAARRDGAAEAGALGNEAPKKRGYLDYFFAFSCAGADNGQRPECGEKPRKVGAGTRGRPSWTVQCCVHAPSAAPREKAVPRDSLSRRCRGPRALQSKRTASIGSLGAENEAGCAEKLARRPGCSATRRSSEERKSRQEKRQGPSRNVRKRIPRNLPGT